MWPERREPGKGNKWEQWAVPGPGTAGSHAHCPAVPGTRLTSVLLANLLRGLWESTGVSPWHLGRGKLGSSQEPRGSPWLWAEEGGMREPRHRASLPFCATGRAGSGPPPRTPLAWETGGPGSERAGGGPPWPP